MDDQELSSKSCAFLRNCWIAGYVSRPVGPCFARLTPVSAGRPTV